MTNEYCTGEFAATLLNAATTAHFMHLSTRSYATHMALGSFYAELPDLVDAVVEQCQGKHGLVEFPEQRAEVHDDPATFLSSLADYVKIERESMPQDSEIQNSIDEIVSLIDGTLYKLRFLS